MAKYSKRRKIDSTSKDNKMEIDSDDDEDEDDEDPESECRYNSLFNFKFI